MVEAFQEMSHKVLGPIEGFSFPCLCCDLRWAGLQELAVQ